MKSEIIHHFLKLNQRIKNTARKFCRLIRQNTFKVREFVVRFASIMLTGF